MNESKIIQDTSFLESNKQAIEQSCKNIQSEDKTRHFVLDLAGRQGCYGEAKQIMDKYDQLLLRCTNPQEKKHIAIMGIAELHKLLNVQGALVVNGVEILPAIGEIRDII